MNVRPLAALLIVVLSIPACNRGQGGTPSGLRPSGAAVESVSAPASLTGGVSVYLGQPLGELRTLLPLEADEEHSNSEGGECFSAGLSGLGNTPVPFDTLRIWSRNERVDHIYLNSMDLSAEDARSVVDACSRAFRDDSSRFRREGESAVVGWKLDSSSVGLLVMRRHGSDPSSDAPRYWVMLTLSTGYPAEKWDGLLPLRGPVELP